MAARNSNLKNQKPGKSSLRKSCWRRGLSVTALASKIGKNRTTLYFAWEDPRRYPLTFKLIQEALAE